MNFKKWNRKPQSCSSKNMRWDWMHVLFRADQRLKHNHKDVFLPVHPQKLYLLGKELGPMLNRKIIRPPIIQCRRNWSIFFVMVVFLEKMMERSNSGDEKIIFRTIIIVLTTSGKKRMARGGGKKKNIVVLYWFFRRYSLPPSSSRSFRTQSYCSFITGQCLVPERFL